MKWKNVIMYGTLKNLRVDLTFNVLGTIKLKKCKKHGEHSVDGRFDDHDGDSFYYDYLSLWGELVRERMTQQTGAQHGVLQALSEDGSELGPLGASTGGDNCHRSPSHLAS